MDETAAGAILFPEDVVREILVRVEDAATLFRCAVACRRWRRLVTKPSFLRRRWPPSSSSFLSGFFTEKRLALTDPAAATSLVPTPGTVFGPNRRFLGSFFPDMDMAEGGLLDGAEPLVARHGFLLVRLAPPADAPVPPDRREDVHMAVFNLLAGTCSDVLPPLKWKWHHSDIGCTIVTGADCCINGSKPTVYSPLFKVLIIKTDMCGLPRKLHTFTSGDATWSTPHIFALTALEIGRLKHPNAVVHRGAAHWLVPYSSGHGSGLDTLNVDIETCHVSLTKIAIPIQHFLSQKTHDNPRLSISGCGALSLLHLQRPGFLLDIWTRQEDDGASEDGGGGGAPWLKTVLELKPPPNKHIQVGAEAMFLTFLGEKGDVMLLKDNHRHFYAVDLKSGAMEELMDCGRLSCTRVVPFEMDWPTFFVSRLGTR